MRTYNQSHAYYCGIDLHARSLYLHVLDDKGTTRLERDIPASPAAALNNLISPIAFHRRGRVQHGDTSYGLRGDGPHLSPR